MLLAGKTVPTSDVVAALQARIDAIQAAEVARTAWLAACDHVKSENTRTDVTVRAFDKMVGAMFDTQTDVLADFAIVPPKRSTPSAETTAQAVVKTKATKQARLSLGPKKRKQIKAPSPTLTPIK